MSKHGKHKKTTEAFTLYLPDEMIAALRAWSDKTGTPISWLIRRAIDETLETHKNER